MEGVIQQPFYRSRSHMEPCVAGGVVKVHVPILPGDGAVGKDHVADVAHPLPASGGDEEAASPAAVFRTPWAMCSQPFSVLMGVAPSPFLASVMVW